MVFTSRNELTVIESDTATDRISLDILVKVILERPSNMIYCVTEGYRLFGIISMGDIAREGTKYVRINKNFTCILENEYMKARKLFYESEYINALPIVNADSELLGAYTRWDDLKLSYYIYRDKGIEWLCEHYNHVFLVCPGTYFKEKRIFFEKIKNHILLQGIKCNCIEYRQIADYIGIVDYLLFIDEDEMRAMYTLCECIWNKSFGKTRFFTYKDVFGEAQCGISYEEMNQYLRKIRQNGVYVLNLLCEHNEYNDEYYKKLSVEIQKKYDDIGRSAIYMLYPDMYESFFDDLYSEKYVNSILHNKFQVETISGFKALKDCQSELYNVENGERYTCGQPKDFERTIYFIGPCYIYGCYTEDKYTIESFLQNRLNETGYKIKVVNCGSLYYSENTRFAWMRIKSLALKTGDIVVYGDCRFDGVPHLNLLDVCKEYNISSKWVTNDVRHCNHKVNAVYADAIYNALKPILMSNMKVGKMLGSEENLVKSMYIERYFKTFLPTKYKKIGSVVMNCNPFTVGHRYLIEQALERVDFLIIFVVEENKSIFSFDERLTMVVKGTEDFNNLMVVPSGPFILSNTTFPEYFIKARDEDLIENIENDIKIFAEKIAPYLNIKYRFVGAEPEDTVTNEYNMAMERILPKYGIEFIEIPRKKVEGQYISATSVRKCLEEYNLEELSKLVPESTRRILSLPITER